MSVKRNAIANYAGQLYSLLISIVTLPIFLSIMGPDAYGLVGFYTVIYAWIMIFDLGITPALSREVARLKTQPDSSQQLASIASSFERLFSFMSFSVAALMLGFSSWISENWLVNERLDESRVIFALQFLAFAVALRWQSTIYRSVINGYEAQVWLNGIDLVISTLRYPLLLLVMTIDPEKFEWFFICQAGISALELIVLRRKHSSLIPGRGELPGFNPALLRPLLPFALSAAYASALGVTLAQYDKLILSSVLPLDEYGYFALVGVITGGILTLSGPISRAILPRLTALLAANRYEEMMALYRQASMWMVVSLSPLIISIALWPYETLFAWTGNSQAAMWVAPVLPLFVAVAGLTSVTVFQYFLQYAHGDLSLNVRFNTALFVVSIPAITYAANTFGVVGVAWILVVTRSVAFVLWIPYVHQRFAPGIHWSWLLNSVIKPLSVALIPLILLKHQTSDFLTLQSLTQPQTLAFIVVTVATGYAALGVWLWFTGRLTPAMLLSKQDTLNR